MLIIPLTVVYNFNPTLVRLRPLAKALSGSPKLHYFNPTLVRLRPRIRRRAPARRRCISIPRWFD